MMQLSVRTVTTPASTNVGFPGISSINKQNAVKGGLDTLLGSDSASF